LNKNAQELSRRERQIMDVLISKGEASAKDVQEALPNPPGYSAVRALIAKMVEKGQVEYRQDGAKHIYSATQDIKVVRMSAMKRLVNTFFGGSTVEAVTGLLDAHSSELTDDQLDVLERKIAVAKKRSGR